MKGNNKSKYTLFIIIGLFVIIGLGALGISFALKDEGNFLKNQKVDGLSFENAKVEYKDKVSTFSVIVYNENEDKYDVESIDIQLKDKDGKDVVLTSNIDMPLETDEGRLISATIDSDITDMKSLKYVINK